MVLKVIALVFQRIARLIFDLPPRLATPHEAIDIASAHAQVRHPAKVLDLGRANLPILDAMNAAGWVRRIERQVIDKAEAMEPPRSAVVSLIRGDPSVVLRRLQLLEEIGMIAFFDTQDVGQTVHL